LISAIVATIRRPIADGEGHKIGNDNKERELRAIFELLTPIEAFALRGRVAADRATDELVVAFKRLTIDRRTRLIAFLADPRRGRI
jgi:hypothetical protein